MSEIRQQLNDLKGQVVELTDKYFPERQIVLRTDAQINYVKLSKHLQMTVCGCAFAFLAWSGYTSISHFMHASQMAAKDQEILSVQVAYRSLLSEVDDYQEKFTNINNELEANHSMLVASLDDEMVDNKDKLVSAEAARKEAQIARQHLKSQLRVIEDAMHDMSKRNFSLKGDLSLKEMDLQTALAERNAARTQKSHLENELKNSEMQIARLESAHAELIDRVTLQANEEISDLESILKVAGLDPDKMLNDMSADENASGGPFIAAVDDEGQATQDATNVKLSTVDTHLTRWQNLQSIKLSMPLAAPLDYYYISSRFGKRRDPVNKRWAVHYGLDMAASKKSPVYVTAPGKVKFVGWKGNYGKFIVVDHGNGIETRYGHLHKTLVKKGEDVDFRTKIGLVGNTGRSTGSHLHYEIRVKEKHVDPYKFIKAGRNVFQG